MPKTHTIPWRVSLLLCLIGCLFFSYYPFIAFGTQAGAHVHLSLLHIIGISLILACLPILWQQRRTLWSSWLYRILLGFGSFASISVLWSPNQFRAVTTVGVLWMVIALSSIIYVYWPTLKRFSRQINTIIGTIVLLNGLWALWQIFGDALGVPGVYTLLPGSYQSAVFGVARPTGFALEPQFFASLLLAPFAWLLYTFVTRPSRNIGLGLLGVATLLLLTLSRGAFLAAGIIVIALIVFMPRKEWPKGIAILFGSVFLTSSIIMAAAALNTRDTISGYDALRRSVSQMSLGTVTLPPDAPSVQSTPSTKPQLVTPASSTTSSDGYIESSTTTRLSTSRLAIDTWRQSSATILFGVGIGGFGASVHTRDISLPIGSVVNNYYLEMLAELGLIGIGLFITFLGGLIITLIRKKQFLISALLLGVGVQWCFFSGNPNVIHVWVILGVGLGLCSAVKPKLLLQ